MNHFSTFKSYISGHRAEIGIALSSGNLKKAYNHLMLLVCILPKYHRPRLKGKLTTKSLDDQLDRVAKQLERLSNNYTKLHEGKGDA